MYTSRRDLIKASVRAEGGVYYDPSAAVASASSTRERGTLLSIQILRALAALAVVVAHLNREFEIKLGVPDLLPTAVLLLGNAGVDLFFVISGFIMVHVGGPLFGRPDAPGKFFVRRAARIIPLYWAVSGVLLVYVLTNFSDLASANLSVPSIVASFIFLPYPEPDGTVVPINGIGWTLNYEMFFYAVFAIALLARRTAAVIGISVLFVVISVTGVLLWPLPNPFAFWADSIILDFVFGMLVALAFANGLRLPRWGTFCVVAAGLAATAGAVLGGIDWLPRFVMLGAPAALIVAGLVLSGQPTSNNIVWRALGFLGDASYALYLVHPMAMTIPRRVFPGLLDPAGHPWLDALVLVLTAVTVAIVVHLLFEKPVTRALQKRIAERSRSRALG